MRTQNQMEKVALDTQDVYRRKALRFDGERSKTLFEREWLERFEGLLPDKAAILDVGCGGAEPIAGYFINRGYELTGIDYAETMIRLAMERFPGSAWQVADMRNLDLKTKFDGIIGWHSFFHLTQDEQRATLPVLAKHLRPGGALMLTVGPAAGETIGHVGGEVVYHSSLAPDEYRQILQMLGLRIVDFAVEDPGCDLATILLAQNKRRNLHEL